MESIETALSCGISLYRRKRITNDTEKIERVFFSNLVAPHCYILK